MNATKQITKIALTLLLFAVAALAQDYEIRIGCQRCNVGSKQRIQITGTELMKTVISAANQPDQVTEEGFTVQFTADATVLETDAKGHITAKSFSVVSSKITQDGVTKPLLPPGSVILAKVQGEEKVFHLNGKPVDDNLKKVLSFVIQLYSGGLDDNELFGTRERKKVGESWSISDEAMMKFLKEFELKLPKEELKSKMTLVNVEDNHLHISGTLAAKNGQVLLPEGFKSETSEVGMDFFGKYPFGKVDDSLEEGVKVVVVMPAKRESDGKVPEIRMKVIYESNTHTQIK